MRKLLLILILTLLTGTLAIAQTTPNLGLNIPTAGTQNWNVPVNANFSKLDTFLACFGTSTIPGTLAYYNGTNWVCFNGNSSGTNVLQENSAGIPSWVPSGGGGGSGTVTSVATTSPLAGGPITTTGTLTCPTCIIANAPALGIGHFAGATQTITSSPVNLVTEVTGNLPVTNLASGTNANASNYWRGDGTWAAPAGTVSGLTLGFMTKAAGPTSLANSLCDEGITTANTLTCTNSAGIVAPAFSGATFNVRGATSGSAPITATNTGGTLNLGSTNATVDPTGNAKFAGVATGSATVPAFNGANFPYIAAPSTPAASLDSLYVDSTDLRLHDKNASGAIGTTVVPSTCSGSNFVSSITTAGVLTCTTPAGSGTVTSIGTTGPITGGTITTTGTIACATCVTSSSPGAGIAHFAGSTQAVTSSLIVAADITSATITGTQIANATVTATQLAAQYSKGSCTELWGGSGTSFALTAGDDAISNNSCYNDSGVTRTITAVKCRNDNASNTTTVNPTFGASGTGTTILSGALTCGSSYAYSSTGTVSNASWTTGTGITPAMSGTLTGTSIAMIVEYTY